jgi:hypothetical protein
MKSKNVKRGLALTGVGALGMAIGGNAYSQTTQNTNIADTLNSGSHIEILDSYVTFSRGLNKTIDFNVNKDSRYGDRPSIIIYSDARTISGDFREGAVTGMDAIDEQVVMNSIHPKMNRAEFGPINNLIMKYLDIAFNNEDNGRRIGEFDVKEQDGLFKLLDKYKEEYKEFFGVAVVHYDATKIRENGVIKYNPSKNVAIPFQIVNSYINNGSPETTLEDKVKVPGVENKVSFKMAIMPGYTMPTTMLNGAGALGIGYGHFDVMAFGDYGRSLIDDKIITNYPNKDNNGGTKFTDATRTQSVGLGGLIEYHTMSKKPNSKSGFGILAGAKENYNKNTMTRTIVQDVSDQLGNYKKEVVNPAIVANNHFREYLGGLEKTFNNGWGVIAIGGLNSQTGKVDQVYLGVSKRF